MIIEKLFRLLSKTDLTSPDQEVILWARQAQRTQSLARGIADARLSARLGHIYWSADR